MTSVSNLVCRKCKRVKEPSGFSYMLKVCDACTDYHRVYIASKREHLKQYEREYYAKNQELLGMAVEQYKLLDDCKIACPLCQSIVSKVNMSTHKKSRKCKKIRNGQPTGNYRHTIQTDSIFDGVNAGPRIVKHDIYIYLWPR